METGKPIVLTNQGREPAAKGPMKSLVAEGCTTSARPTGARSCTSSRSDPEETSNLAAYPFAAEPLRRLRSQLSAMLEGR